MDSRISMWLVVILASLTVDARAQFGFDRSKLLGCDDIRPQAEVARMIRSGLDPTKLGICPDKPFSAEEGRTLYALGQVRAGSKSSWGGTARIDETKLMGCEDIRPQAAVAAMIRSGLDPTKLGVCPDKPFTAEEGRALFSARAARLRAAGASTRHITEKSELAVPEP
ncbi:MAG: hypothetical protein Q7J64_03205 [Elusimicrobiota bacterium]|nr:hypothetical protein [Elusimicrobiota bacterium]